MNDPRDPDSTAGAATPARAKVVPRHGTPRRSVDLALKPFLSVVILFVAALGLRLAYVHQTREVPFLWHLEGDAKSYYGWAQRIAAGDWMGDEAFYQAPLYPYALGAWSSVWSDNIASIRVLQALWGSFGVVFLYLATRRLFGPRVGLVAGLMLAAYPPAMFFDGIIQKASLVSVLLCALLWVMVITIDSKRARWPVALGVLVGLLCLTRENALIWLGALALWLVVSPRGTPRRVRCQRAALFLAGGMAVLFPVAARNRYVGGQWSLTTVQSGPNFFIGNGADATGLYRPLVRGHETPDFERADATRLAEEAAGRALSPREVSRYWLGRATSDIREAPARWIRLLARKTLMVVNHYEVADMESQRIYGDYSPMMAVWGRIWHFGILLPLAAAGLVLTWPDRSRLWVFYLMIGSMTAAVAMFYILARYRYPLVPLLMPFAAVACVEVWKRVGERDYRALLVPGGAALISAVIALWPLHPEDQLDAFAYMNLGVTLAQQGEVDEAMPFLRRAVEVNAGSVEAHFNLAHGLMAQGDSAGAIAEYKTAVGLDPNLADVHFFLARALEQAGDEAGAIEHYRATLRLNPQDDEARAALVRLGG